MVKLAEIMEEVRDPRAQAVAQLKESLNRVLGYQAEIPSSIKLGLDGGGVILYHPDSDDIHFENCMTMVCGLNEVCDAVKSLRPIQSVPYLLSALDQIGFEEILKPVVAILETKSDASFDALEKIEDHLAIAKFMEHLSVYFADTETPLSYSSKATEYNELAQFNLDLRFNSHLTIARLLNALTPLLEPIEPDVSIFDEGRFVLSAAQTTAMRARIITLANAAIINDRVSPVAADMLINMLINLPPEQDEIASQLGAGLFDKMSAGAQIKYVTDLADLTLESNKPHSKIDDPILSRYAKTVGGLAEAIANHGGVAEMMDLKESAQKGLDLEDRNPN